MRVMHRPDLDAYYRVDGGGQDGQDNLDAYMWPHINLEDLLPPTTMLRLLNSRGRNSPGTFPAMDLDSIDLGRNAWSIKERNSNDRMRWF